MKYEDYLKVENLIYKVRRIEDYKESRVENIIDSVMGKDYFDEEFIEDMRVRIKGHLDNKIRDYKQQIENI